MLCQMDVWFTSEDRLVKNLPVNDKVEISKAVDKAYSSILLSALSVLCSPITTNALDTIRIETLVPNGSVITDQVLQNRQKMLLTLNLLNVSESYTPCWKIKTYILMNIDISYCTTISSNIHHCSIIIKIKSPWITTNRSKSGICYSDRSNIIWCT